MTENLIETVLVCYTQGSFDQLAWPDLETDGSADAEESVATSRQIAVLAENLIIALGSLKVEAEIVKLPLPNYSPAALSKAALAWRLLDLTESNGRLVDLLICLDFPAWSVSHPRKVCWLQALPFFVTRQQVANPFLYPSAYNPARVEADPPEENATIVKGLLQAERRGLNEARRVFAAQRPVAEELARSGLQVEFNPAPSPQTEPSAEAWQKVAGRFLT